jgi:helix-turn-helix protein
VRKKVAWKSSTSYGIVVNLFNYSKLTQELQNKKEKHIEELNKSYEREKEKYHIIVNWMTLLHKNNCLTYTRIKK